MKKIIPILSVLLVFGGCAGTQQQNQNSADQVFGKAKLALMIGSGAVAVYNVGCASTVVPASICTKQIMKIVNDALAQASDAVAAAEAVFADVNSTQDARLAAAKATTTIVAAMTDAINKYGLARQ